MVADRHKEYYHMITIPVKEKLEKLEVIEGEEDSMRTPQPTIGSAAEEPLSGPPQPPLQT